MTNPRWQSDPVYFVICHFESRAGDHEGGFFHDGFAKPGGIVVRGVRGKSLEER